MTATAGAPSAEPVKHEPVRLITLSREYGAGGSELGMLLGERLGWPVLDRDLARRTASRLRCRCEDVEALDEHAPTFLERIASAFTVVPSDAPILPEPLDLPDCDALARATRAVLLEAARTPPLIVIGHGATCLFHGRRDVLHVRVTAPFEARVRRVAARTGAGLPEAAADVRRRDADRRHYLARYYDSDANDCTLYDVQFNTATISLDTAARLVTSLVHAETS
ncbi:MAG TPA: cytidylate kinase-like family protein [Gemmatimonadaceae bacterium]|nr:cytidylate kinase-like family protein [Gemmatimonadaceae bacterium]